VGNLSNSGPSVADLLSQLRASQSLEPASNVVEGSVLPARALPHTDTPSVSQSASAHPSDPQQDMRTLSFQQALPHISRLMEDPLVAKELMKVIK
jgi:hypothetical protein